MKVETRTGSREIEVQTLKRRTSRPLHGQPLRGQKDLPLDMFDLLERVERLKDLVHAVERGSRDPERSATDKNELVRAIGRLEADLRRRGVR